MNIRGSDDLSFVKSVTGWFANGTDFGDEYVLDTFHFDKDLTPLYEKRGFLQDNPDAEQQR